MKRVFKIGCLTLVVAFIGLILLVIFEPDALRNRRLQVEREAFDSAQYYIDEVSHRMKQVRHSLPILLDDAKPMPFPAGPIPWNSTLPTSVQEVFCFTDSGFVITTPLQHGPWLTQIMRTIEDSYSQPKEKWNTYTIKQDGRNILNRKYLMVYDPIYYWPPKVLDKKSFQPGYFDGWMIFLDFTNGDVLGYSRFQFYSTLYQIKNNQIGVGVGPLSLPLVSTTDVQKELNEDFRNAFFNRTDSTFLALKINNVSHSP